MERPSATQPVAPQGRNHLPLTNYHLLSTLLLPYQRAFVEDAARFKIGLWSRQTGKSFATACEAVLHCLLHPGALWVVLSAGERQAIEWMRKARQWAEALRLAVEAYDELREGQALMTRAEIAFANKSRILAIPANPDTARGYSANLVLDEFAIHEKPWDIWAAIYPSITNPLSGKKLLRVVSTPKGMGNKFADLWFKNEAYSKHKVTILDAKAQGLPVDLDELRAGVDDPDIWAQEYLCEFIDSSSVLLPYDLIAACEAPGTLAAPGDAPRFVGMDVGRSKDLSVVMEGAQVGGVLWLTRVEILRRKPFAEQLQALCAICADPRVRRVAVDATGIGAMLAEEARRRLGGRVEPVTFTVKSKGELYAALHRRFEDRALRIPADRDLREDLHAVQRNVSAGGAVTYAAPRSEDGHSDRAAAEEAERERAAARTAADRADLVPALDHYRKALRLLSSIREEDLLLNSPEADRFQALAKDRRRQVDDWFAKLDRAHGMGDTEAARTQATFIRDNATLEGEAPDRLRAEAVLRALPAPKQ